MHIIESSPNADGYVPNNGLSFGPWIDSPTTQVFYRSVKFKKKSIFCVN